MNQTFSRAFQKGDCGCGCGKSSIINNVVVRGRKKSDTVAYAKQSTTPSYKSIKDRFFN